MVIKKIDGSPFGEVTENSFKKDEFSSDTEEILKTLYALLPAGVAILDVNHRIIDFNLAFGKIMEIKELTWHPDFGSGNEAVDEQHKKLIKTSSHLLSALSSGSDKVECISLIERLLEETAQHFRDDEEILCIKKLLFLHTSLTDGHKNEPGQ